MTDGLTNSKDLGERQGVLRVGVGFRDLLQPLLGILGDWSFRQLATRHAHPSHVTRIDRGTALPKGTPSDDAWAGVRTPVPNACPPPDPG